MLSSDNIPRNKILVVGRRGVGKLSLVQSILGSRFVPTTSVSKSRPSSPLILPAIPVPTLEETILTDDQHGVRLSQGSSSTFTPPTVNSNSTVNNAAKPTLNEEELSSFFTQLSSSQEGSFTPAENYTQGSAPSGPQPPTLSQTQDAQTRTRPKLDHSGVTIPWTIDTKYYSVQVDFWIDETEAHGRAEMERMIDSGELDDLGAVVEAVVFCFSKNQPSTFHDIKPWLSFVERHEPSITLCVATDAPMAGSQDMDHTENEIVDDYDDWCLGNGFEFIDLQDQPSDMISDEHVGLDRIMEALAAHMWDGLKRKSSKKRDQHDRSMMMSFRDDDVDMTGEYPWKDHNSRRSLRGPGLGLEAGDLDSLNESMLENEDDGDDDDDDEDEDDDRAFYKALAELNLHNRSASPTAPTPGSAHGLPPNPISAKSINGTLGGAVDMEKDAHGFDDDFDFDSQEIKVLEGNDLGFWSSQESTTGSDLKDIDQSLERQFKQFLGKEFEEDYKKTIASSGLGVKGLSSGELDSLEKDFSFELGEDHEFEFGDYVSSSTGGAFIDEDLPDFEFKFGVDGMSTPKQESIRTMHQALFANIDEDDGMSQTIATLQGLREQGRNMSEQDRRELAARVALSFGMQMGE
ncbi:hypothetical protein BGZ72_001733 [Mortierella alpina]|nr:hypothetical protein BGZ72_001733 [Mortierella alpina]